MFSQISKPALAGPTAIAFRTDDEPVRSNLTRAFRHLVCAEPASDPILKTALVHLVSHPGSLIRARMAWHVGQTCGLSEKTSRNLAIGVEYFHTASLVFDDLACMDDASVRRNTVCVHKRFGEATAILAALALINRAYALIWGETADLAGGHGLKVSRFVESCLGTSGVLSGQSRDLNFNSKDESAEEILEIAAGKTVTLLKLALCLPGLVADASSSTIDRLAGLALARGLGYQIADDFKDVFQEENESGKTSNRDRSLERPNLVTKVGVPPAARRLNDLVHEGDEIEKALLRDNPGWSFLNDLRIAVGPALLNKDGVPLSGDL